MFLEGFIASRMKFKSGLAIIATAISFFVIIISVAISSGFSFEIRKEVSGLCGDIVLSNSFADYSSDLYPINIATKTDYSGVLSSQPSIYRSAIAQNEDFISGVIFKGTNDITDSLNAKIPSQLALKLGLSTGDSFTAYFIGEDIEIKDFIISEIYTSSLSSESSFVVFAGLKDLQEINAWTEDEASVIELEIDPEIAKSRKATEKLCRQIAVDSELAVFSSRDKYSELFDWLEMIEYNVAAIILLMTIVAGFNMISGLLILIFRNMSTIGKLKTLGMRNRSIAEIFLRAGARITALGMLIGNALALIFCLVQGSTHFLKLNPEHYFVPFVPVALDIKAVLLADAIAFVAILLLLLIPTLFISRLDPSQTVRSE